MEETIRFLCNNCNCIVMEVVGKVVFEFENEMSILCKACIPTPPDKCDTDAYLDAMNEAKTNITFKKLIEESGIDIS